MANQTRLDSVWIVAGNFRNHKIQRAGPLAHKWPEPASARVRLIEAHTVRLMNFAAGLR